GPKKILQTSYKGGAYHNSHRNSPPPPPNVLPFPTLPH
ncbi:hypothetical protein CCACVL1_12723, partial [Corchorus capsularis]